jgi:hypothetical protein
MRIQRRRTFIHLPGTLLAALLLFGCGGGLENASSGFSRSRGVVQLPAGMTAALSTLTVSAPNGSSIRPDGSFEYDRMPGGDSLVIVANQDGKPVLAGFTDGDTAPIQINTQTTAVAILFYASGSFTLPPDQHNNVRRLIAAHAAVPPLATALEQRLAANPGALADRDPQLQSAIQTALDSMGANRSRAAKAPTRGRAEEPSISSQLLAQPLEAQSGMIVSSSDDLVGLQVANTRRRNLLLFITQTGYEDAQGVRHDVDLPVVSGAFPKDWIVATNKLVGAIGSVVDVVAGNGSYQPVISKPPIPLPVNPTTAKKSFYRVTLAGPGIDPGRAPKEGAKVKTAATEMLGLGFVKDIFLPLLFSALDIHLNFNELLNQQGLLESTKGLISILAGGGHVAIGLTSFEPKEVALSVLKTMTDDYVFRQAILNWVTQFLIAHTDIKNVAPILAGNVVLTRLSFFLAILDKGFALGDASVTAYDWGQSNYFEEWEVTAIPPRVDIRPGDSTVINSEFVVLKAETPVTGSLVYHWKTDGVYGHLLDAKGHSGAEFDTTADSVSYVGDKPPDTGEQIDKVTVTIYKIPTEGPSQQRIKIGSATVNITRKKQEQYGQVKVNVLSATDVEYSPGNRTDFARLVPLGEKTYTMQSATKTPSSLGQFINSAYFHGTPPSRYTFQWHGHVPSISSGVSVPAKPDGFAGSLTLYLPYELNGVRSSLRFEAISGTITITGAVGDTFITWEANARLGWDPPSDFTPPDGTYGYIDVTISGYTTLVDEKRSGRAAAMRSLVGKSFPLGNTKR